MEYALEWPSSTHANVAAPYARKQLCVHFLSRLDKKKSSIKSLFVDEVDCVQSTDYE